MKRRSLLQGIGAVGASLAAPSIVAAQGARVLKFVPHADVTVLDPIWTTAYITRTHGAIIFETLFSLDTEYRPHPQMVEGMTVENDGKLVRLTLRDGLKFHDGEKVLARDCVASIQRWAKRDTFGQTLMVRTDELSAVDDKTIQFRLKVPFPLLPDALGKATTNYPVMMPERLAKTDAFTQVTEMVGSGPFRFVPSERNAGARTVYERNPDYVPRNSPTSGASGARIVHFDRVEFIVNPDIATTAAAIQRGDIDWWEAPSNDILPLLARNSAIQLYNLDPTGAMACMRLNHLVAPFDNPAIRRALLKAIDQADFMAAAAGDNPDNITIPAGIFCPKTPMASDAGLEVFRGKRDYEAVKREIIAAGYKGEPVVVLAPTDISSLKGLTDVGADMMKKIGLNVDYQAMDWGTVVQRRAKKEPIAQGGWSVFHTTWTGGDHFNPLGHLYLRGLGPEQGTMGWPKSERLEALRDEWIAAPDLDARRRLAAEIQKQAMLDVPYVPLGQFRTKTAYRKTLTDVLEGWPMFWNVKRVSA
jgi:peptide/nickel transport system substrate-binding protein